MIENTYNRLKKEFIKIMQNKKTRLENNPRKQSFYRNVENGVVTSFTNVMFAKTDNGVISKTISLDDLDKTKDSEEIIYTNNNGNIYKSSNCGLTILRCALMACLSIDLCIGFENVKTVGFIGNGKINLKTCEILSFLFGINNFIIRGRKCDISKNLGLFKRFGNVYIDDNYKKLNSCDVVICCTNSIDKNDVIENDVLKDVPLVISQDGGYIFGETFRKKRINYTDHIEQLNCHYLEEFPYDLKKHKLKMIVKEKRKRKKAVWLYGIALADAIIYEEEYICN